MPWQMTTFCKPHYNHRTAQLYFLKKIHKNPMGIRPIVSSVNSIMENISKYVDLALSPGSPIFSTVHEKRGGAWYAKSRA